MLLGAVDLGSNSFRVEIGRVDGDRIVTQSYWKETIRMAAGFDKNGALTPEMQEKALAALSRFHEKLAGLPATQVRAVGTQALREAANSSEFLPKAEAALGYPIGILSGHEEARLVFKGCARTLPPSDKRRLVVDIGGGTTEVGLISLGGMVYAGSVRVGGDKFDQTIINYIRRNFGMLIGEPTAEMIKKKIGSAFPGSEVMEIEVKGRNIAEGVPRTFTVHSNEILEALSEPLNQIVVAVKNALEKTPPELGADIAEHGLMLTGGGALLRDLDQLLKEETGLPVHVAEEPLNCVVKGCGIALENMDKLRTAFAAG